MCQKSIRCVIYCAAYGTETLFSHVYNQLGHVLSVYLFLLVVFCQNNLIGKKIHENLESAFRENYENMSQVST